MTKRFPCPCCGFLTLIEPPPGTYGLCEVCWWEDDGVQFTDPTYTGGANEMSLTEARQNFRTFGAIDREALKHVRPPHWFE